VVHLAVLAESVPGIARSFLGCGFVFHLTNLRLRNKPRGATSPPRKDLFFFFITLEPRVE